ncbi:MAG: DMT family transporter [Muribaculaceae bacterium]|nr:DMT family transporter [Muribaculaceae bacterium]MDE5596013.1 DMT family transporter [Muribaculaceae bacterium]
MESEKISSADTSSRLRGHLAMLVAAVLWGAMSPIAKHVMLSGAVPPLALSAIRIVGGAAVFWIAGLFLPERISGNGRIAVRDIPVFILMSVLIVSANQGLYIVGIGYTTPFEATVMTTMTPVFTMLLAAVFISMPMTFMKVSGVALGLGGALLLAFSSRGNAGEVARNPMLGNLMCLGAQLCAALYFTMFRRVIARYHPFVLLKWLFLAGSVTWVPFTWRSLAAIRPELFDTTVTLGVVFIVLFPTFLSYLFMVYAQQRLKPTSVAMYNYVQPLTAAVLAAIMGLAVFGWTNIFATVMIFAGVALVAFSPGQTKKLRS